MKLIKFNYFMKRLQSYLIMVLVLTLSLQSWTKADDISDFQIEGMSIGDSALDYFSKKELKKQKRNYWNSKKFIDSEMFLNNSKYHSIHIIYNKSYKIEGLSATLLYQNNISDCYRKLDSIDIEVGEQFNNLKKKNKNTVKHRADKTGKSKITDIIYDFRNGDRILLACYDWSKKMGYSDHLRISLRTLEYENFLNNEAYK